ncbi:MAG: hypothetical protein NZ921_01570 [Candidatus Caldarchaeum sp.]|nr:hypothetical protein [Candidatus Caldarchaeum sp.]
MADDIKREILRLLEVDEEFKYAVAGKLGLLEILKELRAIWEEVKELRKGHERLWENQTTLWEEVKALREGQEKLWHEVKELREGQTKLWEEVKEMRKGQGKLWEEVKMLREDHGRLEKAVARLEEAVALLMDSHRELAKQVGALSETLGFGLEDIARVVMPGWLLRHEGIRVDGEFVRRWFVVDGEELEVNLYGEGEREGRRLFLLGDVKSRIYRREVEAFDDRAEKVAKTVGGDVYKFMFGYLIHPSAEEEGRRRRVALIASYMR